MIRSLPLGALLCVAVGLAVAEGISRADPGKDATRERIARLIQQLGHEEFAKRQAASKELEAIGEPALDALRKAAASDRNLEVRRRAERIIQAVTGRIREAAANKELQKLQGTWTLVTLEINGRQDLGEDKKRMFIFEGDKWTLKKDNEVYQSGTIRFVDPTCDPRSFDLLSNVNGTEIVFTSIYRIEGDTLRYCTGAGRPKAFVSKEGDGFINSVWKRKK